MSVFQTIVTGLLIGLGLPFLLKALFGRNYNWTERMFYLGTAIFLAGLVIINFTVTW